MRNKDQQVRERRLKKGDIYEDNEKKVISP